MSRPPSVLALLAAALVFAALLLVFVILPAIMLGAQLGSTP